MENDELESNQVVDSIDVYKIMNDIQSDDEETGNLLLQYPVISSEAPEAGASFLRCFWSPKAMG